MPTDHQTLANPQRVYLLSLNTIPGPVIAHRRALCTIAGGAIALVIHLDALRRHRAQPTKT